MRAGSRGFDVIFQSSSTTTSTDWSSIGLRDGVTYLCTTGE